MFALVAIGEAEACNCCHGCRYAEAQSPRLDEWRSGLRRRVPKGAYCENVFSQPCAPNQSEWDGAGSNSRR